MASPQQQQKTVSILEVSSIAPASPTAIAGFFFLSALDICWQDVHYNRRLVFYSSTAAIAPDVAAAAAAAAASPPAASADAAIETLKTSLSAVLVHYYPWAGRLALDPHSNGRLAIDCNDKGVEFIEASVDMSLRSEIARHGFPMMPLYDSLCPDLEHAGDRLYSSPLLSIQFSATSPSPSRVDTGATLILAYTHTEFSATSQDARKIDRSIDLLPTDSSSSVVVLDRIDQVTRFSDGGISVGVCQSHVVADGQALWDFMVAWGESARGQGIVSAPLPIHDRTLLALKDPPSRDKADEFFASFVWKGEGGDSDGGGGGGGGESEEEARVESIDPERRLASFALVRLALVQCVFDVPASVVRNLKAEAGAGYTAYEVVCAHFWQSVNTARRNPPGAKARFFGLVNLRSKLRAQAPPLLPRSYFGNAVVPLLADARSDDLASDSLGGIAQRIHAAIDGEMAPEARLRFLHWLELHGNRFIELLPLFVGVEKMNVASSPRFPVYEVDFGWGCPAAVRSAKVKEDGEIVLFGGRPNSTPGDMEICIALPSPVMHCLLHDPAFLAKPISDPFLYYQ